MDRLPPRSVVEGLPTKSAKIRALADAGYSRTEIAKFLDVRYQHVRNVLVQAGIDAGTRNDLTRSASKVPAAKPNEPWPASFLSERGFELVGKCRLLSTNAFEYSDHAPNKPGVYAFVVDGIISYIGLTRGALRTRLGHYVYGHEKQKTSARVKGLILASLTKGENVEVYVACPPNLEWNGLPVDGPAGLETGLIRLIRPPWNQHGAT